VVFFPRQGRPPIVQKHPIARWRWRDERCHNLDELDTLRSQDLEDCIVRLTLTMDVNVAQMDQVEAILLELKGNEATHGKAGVLLLDRSGLELNTSDTGGFEANLPDVLKSVAARLKARGQESDGAVARLALYHLYKTVREARQ
jgi:hypothetical protein